MIFEFPDGGQLAAALARHVAGVLGRRLRREGKAALAVSGGTTPVKFFHALSETALDWGAVVITLVDDRWVPEGSPRSNAGLVRRELLRGTAAAARFVPLVNAAATPEEGCAATAAAISALPLPLAAVCLGMGTDGHTASFFPGGDHLDQALDPAPGAPVISMRAPGAGEPRITLTLPLLLGADAIALHIEGAEKRRALDAALASGPVAAMPVRAVLRYRPPDIFWCP